MIKNNNRLLVGVPYLINVFWQTNDCVPFRLSEHLHCNHLLIITKKRGRFDSSWRIHIVDRLLFSFWFHTYIYKISHPRKYCRFWSITIVVFILNELTLNHLASASQMIKFISWVLLRLISIQTSGTFFFRRPLVPRNHLTQLDVHALDSGKWKTFVGVC